MDFSLYTQSAETCLRMARKAKSQPERAAWLRLSLSWVQLARSWATERLRHSDIQPTAAVMAAARTTSPQA
jgi:hypothetical protein